MSKINKKLVGVVLVAGSLLGMSSTLAAEVTFPANTKNGSFNCTVTSDLSSDAEVAVDTHSLDAQGFCMGGKYVVSKGHMRIPGKDAKDFFNTYYFKIKKSAGTQASVTVNLTKGSGNISCERENRGKQPYAEGSGYCAVPPK
jgi:hypothetical protein